MGVVYWDNQKIKDCNLIDALPYAYSCMYNDMYYVYQLMDGFCDRLKFGSTADLDRCTDQNKGRYCEKELLLLLVLLVSTLFKIEYS